MCINGSSPSPFILNERKALLSIIEEKRQRNVQYERGAKEKRAHIAFVFS
jgi:hypothetical protein